LPPPASGRCRPPSASDPCEPRSSLTLLDRAWAPHENQVSQNAAVSLVLALPCGGFETCRLASPTSPAPTILDVSSPNGQLPGLPKERSWRRLLSAALGCPPALPSRFSPGRLGCAYCVSA